MKPPLALLICVILATNSAFANGGGYLGGGVFETGSITGFTPEGLEAVQIAEENLQIALKPKGADVEVRYILKNETHKPAKVRFGFPVEELEEVDEMNDSPASGNKKAGLHYAKDYVVEFDGKAISAKFEEQPDAKLSHPERAGVRGWLISEITVPASAPAPLTVRYTADYTSSSNFVSDDVQNEPLIFQYRLSTGAAWAGPIGKGTVTVRADGVPTEGVVVLAPAGRFNKTSEGWEWNFEKLEPTLDDDLKIQAVEGYKAFGSRTVSGTFPQDGEKPVELIQRGERWFARHGNFSQVTASSTLAAQKRKSYGAKNVADHNYETAWVEGSKGSGAGEWIEATLEVAKPVRSVSIWGGYRKEDDVFKANARPKQIELILNGEHRIEASLADENEETEVPVIGYDKPVETVRAVIKSVYPGEKWQDCAISSLSVETVLDEKPNVQPSR